MYVHLSRSMYIHFVYSNVERHVYLFSEMYRRTPDNITNPKYVKEPLTTSEPGNVANGRKITKNIIT